MLITATDALAAGTTTSAVSGASAQLIAANPQRNGLQINCDAVGASVVYLLLGAGTASATVWHVSLVGAGGSWDGCIAGVLWRGAVQVFGTGTRVAVIET